MKKISSTFEEDQIERVQERVDGEEPNPEEGEYSSRAAALRDLVDKGLEYEDVVEEYEQEITRLEARVDELEAQLQHQRSREEDVEEIVEYVDEEKSYRRAGIVTRAKWWFFGMDDDEE